MRPETRNLPYDQVSKMIRSERRALIRHWNRNVVSPSKINIKDARLTFSELIAAHLDFACWVKRSNWET